MSEKRTLSPTQVDMYATCPTRYEFRYVEGIKLKPAVAMARGRALDDASTANHVQKIASKVDLPLGEIVDRAIASFDAVVAADGLMEEPGRNPDVVAGEGRDASVRLAKVYASDLAPGIQPEAVQVDMTLEMPSLDFGIRGILDLVDQTGVTDIKSTGARGLLSTPAKAQKIAHESRQLTTYAMLDAVRRGATQVETPVRFGVAVDLKAPRGFFVGSSRAEGDFAAVLRQYGQIGKAIQAGSFPPLGLGTWACSPKWCGYWRICPHITPTMRRIAEKDTNDGE